LTFFFQAEDGIRDFHVTGVQTCALPIYLVDARKTNNDALKLSDRVAGVYVLKAKLDIESGDLPAASAALEAAKTLTPDDPEPYYLGGIIAERWQKPEEALAAYRMAAERAPNELAYLLATSEMLMSLDRAPEA